MAGKILELSGDGTATLFEGNYAEYTAAKREEKKMDEPPKKSVPKENAYRSKEERAKDAQRRVRIKQIEEQIPLLEEEEAQIGEDLSRPEVSGNYEVLKETCARLERVKAEIDALYAEYETLLS